MRTVSKATLTMDRSTKGAVLYKNAKEGEGQAITTVYLRKSGLVEPYPGSIEMTITVDDEEGA